jgi:glycosyltransferase involved in cell wall biosynthesis
MAQPPDRIPREAEERIVVLGLYWQPRFWSLGPRTGVNSFFLAPQGFARFGHEVHVSAPRDRGQPAFEDDEGIRLHRYGGAIRFDSNPRSWLPIKLFSRVTRYLYYVVAASWNAWRLGRRVRPDIVIGYHYHGAWPAFLVARLLGVPNLTRLFGTQLNRIFRHPIKRYGAFMQWIAFKTPAAAILMHDDGSEGDVIALRLGVPAGKLHFWRDGYDPTLYIPGADLASLRRSLGIPGEHVILFCVGRMEEDKRMDRLVEMLPAVLREEPRVALMLVGDGGDRPAIERRVRELGIGAHVVLTGAIPRDRLPPYLNLGDIFVGVSDRTNANVPPIEAMSCGKPVVALNTGGTAALIRDGVQGVLVDPARWETELPRALVELIRDPARRAALGLAGQEMVRRTIPTLEERQRMEVDLAVSIVREWRGRRTGRTRRTRRARGERTGAP